MADLKTQQKLIELGEQLAASLEPAHETDMLCRWMAYYIAEQLEIAKSAEGSKSEEAKQRAFDTILALWTHRNRLPNGFRPFKGFEPVMRALEQLDPENPRPAFRLFLDRNEEGANDPQRQKTNRWLEFAHATDKAARVLIDLALKLASREASSPDTAKAVDAAPESSPPDEVTAIRKLLSGGKSLSKEELLAARVELLEKRVSQLAWFRAESKRMEDHLAEQLAKAKRDIPSKVRVKKHDPIAEK